MINNAQGWITSKDFADEGRNLLSSYKTPRFKNTHLKDLNIFRRHNPNANYEYVRLNLNFYLILSYCFSFWVLSFGIQIANREIKSSNKHFKNQILELMLRTQNGYNSTKYSTNVKIKLAYKRMNKS